MRIGFIGLGAMGLPMFRNLIGQYPDSVAYDLSASARQAASEGGLAVADTVQELVGMDVIITMLPNGAAVRDCLLGSTGGSALVPAGLQPGGVVIDMSSSSPLDTADLAKELEEQGFNLVDAPVSGSVLKANNAT